MRLGDAPLGVRYFMLTAEGRSFYLKGRQYQVFRCDCGEYRIVSLKHIRRGSVKSCGCTKFENNEEEKILRSFRAMIERCHSPKDKDYSRYGARGIKVCDRWLQRPMSRGLANFIEDMGNRPSPQHTLDRIDNDGDYCPENCRWTSIDVQSNNRRTNIKITHNNRTLSLSEWARELNCLPETLAYRYRAGWSPAQIIETPVTHANRNVASI